MDLIAVGDECSIANAGRGTDSGPGASAESSASMVVVKCMGKFLMRVEL